MEHVTYLEISYPNFVLGQIIDPEEANQNNYEFTSKINDVVISHNELIDKAKDLELRKSTIVYVDDRVSNLSGTGRTTETVKMNAANLITHKSSTDHDTRYYTKTEHDTKSSLLATKVELATKANKSDTYTKAELAPWLRGGDTFIKEEVFIIVSSNNGDGTFTYSDNGELVVGELGASGEQIFTLISGTYEPGNNRIESMVNDTLRRSVKSGGLMEVSNNQVAITFPEGNGAEITFKYYERIGITGEYNIKLDTQKPPNNNGKNMWFQIME